MPPLGRVTAELVQQGQRGEVLDAFDNDPQADVVAGLNHGAHDRQVALVRGHVQNEDMSILSESNWQSLEIFHR